MNLCLVELRVSLNEYSNRAPVRSFLKVFKKIQFEINNAD